jgi:hypothetical protein
MRGQGAGWVATLWVAGFILNLSLGCAAGLIAVIAQASSLWPIANLFFDFALLATMIYRGPALMQR